MNLLQIKKINIISNNKYIGDPSVLIKFALPKLICD